MALQSINPVNCEVVASFEELTDEQVKLKIALADAAFRAWRGVSFSVRSECLRRLAAILVERAEEYGKLMTLEMGKPLTQAMAEVKKCATSCDFYAENGAKFMAEEVVVSDATESFVRRDPLGVVLAVMPWNFPFWQVVRAAAPALMAGNVMLLKHASNVPQCAMALEKAFLDAGFPEGVFTYLAIGSGKVAAVLDDERVVAATLTGSEEAGAKVAEQCGRNIKKTVLELGGSGPFIVMEDADLSLACATAVVARFQNCGQSCIAAKRFIVMESVYDQFVAGFVAELALWKFGNPEDEQTQIGPMYAKSGVSDIQRQVEQSMAMGARAVAGGKVSELGGAFFEPTILVDVTREMPVMNEETFGPVAAVYKVSSEEEAIEVANESRFGLGASLWTSDMARAKRIAALLDEGGVFVNGMVKSDARLPFGGVKKSGYGRELGREGMMEFVNVKTVWIK
ncbi:NAD-dependent succinate-semialdehyde dehydrogenase [Candidatus Gracilibacteria bacterium]|nr:NAD-dependent succinate-semialdehyde dehydrogenase [Candidatus Gracilibacteria bacterium]